MSQTQHSDPSTQKHDRDLAYAVLVLERQLEATRRLHEEDIASLRAALEELKARILASSQTSTPSGRGSHSSLHSS